ncbi:hypothetical protein C5O75_018605 [Burkholderia cepacia]|uniref:hypothetical protein n=1 Tax=Burkholderia cepacia TaxID=292 RepID=UPI0011B0A358|nr:hypothetical protein [Burkholderia cepacia]KAB1590311.1 hypothetical protein C5O75_018605 [Burkholderia cepacia]
MVQVKTFATSLFAEFEGQTNEVLCRWLHDLGDVLFDRAGFQQGQKNTPPTSAPDNHPVFSGGPCRATSHSIAQRACRELQDDSQDACRDSCPLAADNRIAKLEGR